MFFMYFPQGGVVLVSEEVAERLLPKFSKKADERQQFIKAVKNGSVDQLADLVKSVASGEVIHIFISL